MIHILSTAVIALFSATVMLFANPDLVPGYLTPIAVPGSSGTPQGITIAQSNPSTIYWCRGGIWKSTDGGDTWNRCGTLSNMVHVRVDPKNADHVYVASGVGGPNMGFWRSTDGGINWEMPQGFKTAVSDPTVGVYDGYEVSPDPADFNHILFSFHSAWANSPTCGVLESTDGGSSWRIVYPGNGTSGPGYGIFFLHNPNLGIGDKNTWLMGCQGAGYWRTSDAGATWKKVLNANMVHGGDQLYYSANGALYTGADANAPWRSFDNGQTWQPAESMPASSYFLSVTGDGYFLYTASFNVSGPIYVTPESDGLNWKAYKQPDGTNATLPMGTFEMALDSVNRIMYFSSPYPSTTGIWAMKLISPPISFSHMSVTPATVVSDIDRQVVVSIDIAGSISKAYVDLGLCGGGNKDALTHTTGNTWKITHTVPAGMMGGSRTMVLTAISTGNDTSTMALRLDITDNITPVLVSQGKTATSSSTQQGNVASNAIDGSATTRWESTASDPQWLTVDLGAPELINWVQILWEAAYGSSYQIQISNDGTTWTEAYSTTTGNGLTDDIYLKPATTRYVRMYGTKRGNPNWAFSIFEFKVYSYTTGSTQKIEKGLISSIGNSILPQFIVISGDVKVQVPSNESWKLSLFSSSGKLLVQKSGSGIGIVSLGQKRGLMAARLQSKNGETTRCFIK